MESPASDLVPDPSATPPPAEPDELLELREAIALRDERIASSDARHTAAIDRLRSALASSEPGLRPEMLSGATVEEVEASFAAARQLVADVREAVRTAESPRVPAGAPGRITSAPTSAYEKIRSGLTRLAS